MCVRAQTYTTAPDNNPEVVKTGRLSNTRDNPFGYPVRFAKGVDNNGN